MNEPRDESLIGTVFNELQHFFNYVSVITCSSSRESFLRLEQSRSDGEGTFNDILVTSPIELLISTFWA